MRVPMRGRVRVNDHSADRIFRARLDNCCLVGMMRVCFMRRHRCLCRGRLRTGSHLIPYGGIHLDEYTPQGYLSRMNKDDKPSRLKSLNRIEGQVRGLSRMVEEDRYCIDIVTQISAVRAALARIEEQILREHIQHCVKDAMISGSKADQEQKIENLMAIISRSKG